MRYATYFIVVIAVTFGLFTGITVYKNKSEIDKTTALCKIVRDSFFDDKFDEKSDGYIYGPDVLLGYLVLTESQRFLLMNRGPQIDHTIVYDVWGGKIYVKKNKTSILVRSNGPDLIKNTRDDLEF
jgi:hypothetical protein